MNMSRPTFLTFTKPSGATISRWVILLIAALYFLGPLAATISFTLKDPNGHFSFDAYTSIFRAPATGGVSLGTALLFSIKVTLATIVVALALMVPTQVLLNLYAPRLKPIVEVISLLPLVFPPIVLVAGVSSIYADAAPQGTDTGSPWFNLLTWIKDVNHPFVLVLIYVVMALPFVYRAINSGIESLNLRTLVEASRNLGASWFTTIVRVIMPALRTSMVNAAFLCFALGMGEYTVSAVLGYIQPFPVWLMQLPTTSGAEKQAISVFSLILVEAALLVVSFLTARRIKKGQA